MICWLRWVIFFLLARVAFLLYNFDETRAAGFKNALGSLWYGLRMDLSMSAYIIIPICCFVLLAYIIKFFRQPVVYIVFEAIVLIVMLLLIYADFGLFEAWNARVDASFLKYLSNLNEVKASMAHLPIFRIVLSFVVVYALMLWCSIRFYTRNVPKLNVSFQWVRILSQVLFTGFMIVPIRGGFQLAPLNQSSVYFSDNHFSNLAAINAPWNFLHDVLHSGKNPTFHKYMDAAKAQQITDSLYKSFPIHSSNPFVRNEKPNVILIVWESLSDKVLNRSHDNIVVTPGLNKLLKEGVYFNNMYATGNRTDKGIVGILSGYPAQPDASILKTPSKSITLPMLGKDFRASGYSTAFYYGGELEFANMKAYLMSGGFESFVSIHDFDKKDHNSKWGAHDGVVMQRLVQDLDNASMPFFYTWLTLSSHEPFETPVPSVMETKTDKGKFMNVFHYTDSVVNRFIEICRTQPWWNNTIVIITGDHGHPLPKRQFRHEDFHVPFLITGGAIIKDTVINRFVSQTDIPKTVLDLLNLKSSTYKWSRNMFNLSVNNAFFTFNNGFGYADSNRIFMFDNIGKQFIERDGNILTEAVESGKAMQQQTYDDFLNR
jgi:phosphoglycerol transferase MdoB-like AlkP superfamily enzyme